MARRSAAAGGVAAARVVWPTEAMAAFCDLANVVTWELELPGAGVQWHTDLERLFPPTARSETFRVRSVSAPGPAMRGDITFDELRDVLLAPIVETVRAGIAWGNYELVEEVETAEGEIRRFVVRAVAMPDPTAQRYLGILGDVTERTTNPWLSADIGERLELLVEHSPDGIIVHQDGLIVYANPAAMRMVGLGPDHLGTPLAAFVRPDHIAPVVARLSQLREPGDAVKAPEVVVVLPDGAELPVEVTSVRTSWGGKPAFQVILRDISERKEAEAAALAQRASERQYAAAAAALQEGIVVVARSGKVNAANDSAAAILGRRLERGHGDAIFTGESPARRETMGVYRLDQLPVAAALAAGEPSTNVVLGVTDDEGNDQWLSVSTRLIGDDDDTESADTAAVVCSVSDVTERKRLMDRLAWEARNDPLTGLANRTGFLAAVEDALAEDAARRQTVLFLLDLDRFKLVNDSLGHAMGDEVLVSVAERLRTSMPDAASVSRLHGDEFAVLEPDLDDPDTALQRAEELRTLLSRPLQLSTGRTLTVTPSIGVVRLADVGREASEVLQDADVTMFQAKTRGRGRVAIFDAALRDEVRSRLELEHDLRLAVDNGELRLEYQPVASLANGRVLGLEALVRWEHPRRGLLLPGLFIGLAEESELIVALGDWVLEQACAQMARWRTLYPEAKDMFMAVNVSPRQLEGSQLLPTLRRTLERTGLPAGAMLLEITESALVADDVRMQATLDELRQFGVRLAIDDFGTGYSSLSYVKRLPVSYLKIDRAFVSGLGTDAEDERIVAAVTDLGHGLGLRVIAEGVENRQQRQGARKLGCDLYQGYLLATPRRPRDIPALWRNRR